MKNSLLFFTLIFFVGCKSFNHFPENIDEIATVKNERYEVKYPENWHISNVKGYRDQNSLAIFKYKNTSKKSVWFSLVLDFCTSNNTLSLGVDDLISKDEVLKNSKILEVKKNSKPKGYIEIVHLYKNVEEIEFKYTTRFYMRNNTISKVCYASNINSYKVNLMYKNLFFDTFKLK